MSENKKIFDETNELAWHFYAMTYEEVEPGFDFSSGETPRQKMCWAFAVKAQLILKKADLDNLVPLPF